MTELGRLVDKKALDADGGGRARAKIEVPLSWAKEAALIEMGFPKTLMCARCEGGGCDGCDRSGALRCPESETKRKVLIRLPKKLGDGVALRIAEPFGKEAAITQLWIEVRPAAEPSRFVRRVPSEQRERVRILPKLVLGLCAVLALLILVLVLLTWAKR